MVKLYHTQSGYRYGELDYELDFSLNKEEYNGGLKTAKDLLISKTGGAIKRPAFRKISRPYDVGDILKMRSFKVAESISYLLVFRKSRQIDIYNKQDGLLTYIHTLRHDIDYDPEYWNEANHQSNRQTMILFHEDQPMIALRRNDSDDPANWTLTVYEQRLKPMYRWDRETTVTTKDGPGGRNRTFSKGGQLRIEYNNPIITERDLGRQFAYGIGPNSIQIRMTDLGDQKTVIDGEPRFDKPTGTVISEIDQAESSTIRTVSPTNVAQRELEIEQEYIEDGVTISEIKGSLSKTYIPASNTIRNAATYLREVRAGEILRKPYVEFDWGDEGELIDFIDDFRDNVTITLQTAENFTRTEDVVLRTPGNVTERTSCYFEDKVYILGSNASRKVRAYDFNSGKNLVVDDIELSNDNRAPTGIATDGQLLFVADSTVDKIFAYSLATKSRVRDFEFNLDALNRSPGAIEYVAGFIYVYDTSRRQFFVYDGSGTRDELSEFRPVTAVTDCAENNGLLYCMSGITMRVYDLATRARVTADEIPSAQFSGAGNSTVNGVFSTGDLARIYTVDGSDARIYAYDTQSKIYVGAGTASNFRYSQVKGLKGTDPNRVFEGDATVQTGEFIHNRQTNQLVPFVKTVAELAVGSQTLVNVFIQYTRVEDSVEVVEFKPPEEYQHLNQDLEWFSEAINSERGYAKNGLFEGNRFYLTGTRDLPDTIFGSVLNEFESFQPGSDVDFGFDKSIPSDSQQFIQSAISQNAIMLLCDGGVFTINTDYGQIISNRQGTIEGPLDHVGVSPIRPSLYSNFFVYMAADNKNLYVAQYQRNSDQLNTTNLTELSQNKIDQPRSVSVIENWQNSKYSLIIIVTKNDIQCLCFNPAEEKIDETRAWTTWNAGDKDEFIEGVELDGDFYVTVRREGKVYIEQLSQLNIHSDHFIELDVIPGQPKPILRSKELADALPLFSKSELWMTTNNYRGPATSTRDGSRWSFTPETDGDLDISGGVYVGIKPVFSRLETLVVPFQIRNRVAIGKNHQIKWIQLFSHLLNNVDISVMTRMKGYQEIISVIAESPFQSLGVDHPEIGRIERILENSEALLLTPDQLLLVSHPGTAHIVRIDSNNIDEFRLLGHEITGRSGS